VVTEHRAGLRHGVAQWWTFLEQRGETERRTHQPPDLDKLIMVGVLEPAWGF